MAEPNSNRKVRFNSTTFEPGSLSLLHTLKATLKIETLVISSRPNSYVLSRDPNDVLDIKQQFIISTRFYNSVLRFQLAALKAFYG